MSQTTTMKTTRETLDRIRPYAVFRESWDTALNNALDMLDDFQKESEKNEIVKEEVREEDKKILDDLPREVLEKSIRILDSKNRNVQDEMKRLVRVVKN
jgi:hypothetical protein